MNFGLSRHGFSITRNGYTGSPRRVTAKAITQGTGSCMRGKTTRKTLMRIAKIATGTMNQACMCVCVTESESVCMCETESVCV